ncbi:hypothetical protein Tco_0239392, partial [Tanacetum coccineum]
MNDHGTYKNLEAEDIGGMLKKLEA